ncbi:hypothetical protein LZQ00_17025 [Sphingobacterium sp. SRCM116780]|uniref:hypothetical protein n=1 Tax=Sphingobacterium sp. SRCM116780 TaxID=2907623 RepID=UPI001F35E480|nr:hypothetical protein [Sphingobacterium sp. SRCM116780]UIR55952.1 hypothetical protein LZQ00_17025 [Sphingobacterium sp. SRCM116780]
MNKIIYLGVTQFVKEHKDFVDVNQIYRDIPGFLRPVRKFFFDFDLPFKQIWLIKDFKNSIADYDTIILSATLYNIKISKIIDSYKFKNKQLIFWYWNPVDKICSPSKISASWEKWSFDKKDCEKYNLKYNNTYYFEKFISNIAQETKYQVSFIGQDKGRLKLLLAIEKELKNLGITFYFHVVQDRTSVLDYAYKSRLNYHEILNIIQASDVLLDIVQNGQSGLTLRVMESLFFSKKIISNNTEIIRYDFYNPSNIFIIGKDSLEELLAFMETDYVPINKDILKNYTVENWLNNFAKN